MNRYLLDATILEHVIKPTSSASLAVWLDEQPDESLYICSMNLAEIWNGILELAAGEKRSGEQGWLSTPKGRRVIFGGRVLKFDEKAGVAWARLTAERCSAGLPCAPVDMIYAAIAEANGCILVTGDEDRFTGLNVLNPTKPRE